MSALLLLLLIDPPVWFDPFAWVPDAVYYRIGALLDPLAYVLWWSVEVAIVWALLHAVNG